MVDFLVAGIRLQEILLLVVRGPAALGWVASDDPMRRRVLLVEVVVLQQGLGKQTPKHAARQVLLTDLHHALEWGLLRNHAVVEDLHIFDATRPTVEADVVDDLCRAIREVEVRKALAVDGDLEALVALLEGNGEGVILRAQRTTARAHLASLIAVDGRVPKNALALRARREGEDAVLTCVEAEAPVDAVLAVVAIALDQHPVALLESKRHLPGQVPLAVVAEIVVAVPAAVGGATAAAEVAAVALLLLRLQLVVLAAVHCHGL